MKKILTIIALLVLLCGWQTNVRYLVESVKPVGDDFQKIGSKYQSVITFDQIPNDAKILSVLPTYQELGQFHDYTKMRDELDQIAAAHPDICAVYTIGKSVEGRDIIALRFEPKKPSPGMLFVGEHHAREWMSVEIPMALAHYLAENPKNDSRVPKWLSSFDIWIVPMLNPDGHQFSVTTDRLWRKNRHQFVAGYGVDINRNYGYKWSYMGASGNSDSDIYQGQSSFSEPETQSIRNLSQSIPFLGSITYHTYGNMVIYSWNFGYEKAPYKERLERIAVAMAKQSGKRSGGKTPETAPQSIKDYVYEVMQGSELYCSAGDMCDYMYSSSGTPTFTIEMTDGKTGFINTDDEIQPTVDMVLPMSFEMMEQTPKEYCIVYGKVTDSAGNPVGMDIFYNNIEFAIKSDPATGTYHHVVPTGKSRLRYKENGKDIFKFIDLEQTMNCVNIVTNVQKIVTVSGSLVDSKGSRVQAFVILVGPDGKEVARNNGKSEFLFKGLTPNIKYILKVLSQDSTKEFKIEPTRDMALTLTLD